MHAAHRLHAAQARVDEACGLLQHGSGFAIESCLPLLEDARRLLGAPSGTAADRQAAASLARSLALAGGLARTAASFYRECLWMNSTAIRTYTPAGTPLTAPAAGRTLAEA